MDIKIDLNEPQILAKVTNDRMGLFVANEWKRFINPYTPRDTGSMVDSAKIYPWEIHYIAPYSKHVYYGYDMEFQKNNPYSTYEWDIKAAEAGQLDKLYRTINNGLRSGRI